MKKRFWAMLLAVCMVISVLPTTALAAEDVNLDSKEIVMKFELDKKTYVISASTRNGTLQTGSSTELIGVALGSEGADPSLYTFYFKLVAGTTDQYYITLPYKGVTYYLTGNHDQYLATSSSDATVFSVEADEDGNISSITTEVEKKDHDHNNTTKEIQILCVDESNATTGGLEIESTDANGGAKDGHIAVTVTMAYNDITYQYSEGAPVGAPPLEGYGETHVLAGQTKTVKPAPSLSGYTFSGWETDDVTVDENGAFVMPANDVVFTGSWSANKYTLTIKYVYDNGETAEETHTEQVEYGKTYSVNSPAISGYTANQAVVSGTMPAKDVTVTVTYSPNTARVTYQYEGNVPDGAPALPEVATVTVGTEYKVAAAPTLAGYTFSGWKIDDKAAADFTMPAKDVTITGTWTKTSVPSTPIKPSAALYDTMYYFEQKDGSYMADEKKTARKAGEVGEEVIAAELTPIPNGYAYDPIVTAKRHTATVAVPTPVLGEDGKTVIGVNLTTVERYYSIDVIGGNEGGDGIPDKYQAIVTFKVVNGKWNDETTADKSIVVTLVNEANVWAADGSYTLTESDVPAVGEKPDTNFKAGSWGTPPVGEKITKEATYTYTYARNIEEVVPKAAAYKVEHYKQNADGTWPAEPTEFEFPLVGMIGENVAAVAKDYGKFYCVNEELSEMSGEVFKPFVAEGATEPSYLVLKVYYDLLEANVSITKKADKTSVRVGDNVTYTITVKNTGNVDLTDVKITDEFLDGGKGTKKTEGTWSVTTLKPGESIVAKLVYTTVSDDVNGLKNSAVVDADEIKDTDTTEEVDVKHEPITPVGPPKLNYEDHYAYIVGYPDGLVHPEKNITRAEVATIFFRMLLDESREYFWAQENDFSDVAAADWFNNAVSTLANANLINGYPDGSYRPNNNITRAEFATIAIRFFLDEDVEIEENNLSDVKDHWAEANINLAYALGLIEGYPDDTFRPDQLITRAEAMTIVNRVLKRAPHKDHLLEDMIEWPDNMDEDMWYYADVQEATNSHEFHMYEDKKEDEEYEIWTELLPVRDWAALEREWSEANSSKNPGEVVDINISTPEAGDEGSLKLN